MTTNQIFIALGNNRPPILVRLEDYVLQAIVGVLEGRSLEEALDAVYSQIQSLEDDLNEDEEALNWFNLSEPATSTPLTPPPSEIPSTPFSRM